MKKSLYIGIGGAIGTLLRYFLHEMPLDISAQYRPLLTMSINVSGSFVLGFLLVFFGEIFPVKPEIRLGITTGVLGGYTTFSTFCKETVLFAFSDHFILAVLYAVCSVVFGILAALCGIRLATKCGRRKKV